MSISPPKIYFVRNNIDEMNHRIVNLEKKLFAREQKLVFLGKSFQNDLEYNTLYNLSTYLYKKLNYWVNYLGEFGED